MEDYDCIQICCLFDQEPSRETYESFFDLFLDRSVAHENNNKLDVICENDAERTKKYADASDVAQIAKTASGVTVTAPMGWDNISIGFSRTGVGFPTYSLTPYLTLTAWIYSLKNPDREPLEQVKRRRRKFVELIARAGDILEPKWGFGRRGGLAIGEDQTIDGLTSMATPPLYEYNVFRPETVEAIGRERVLSAPAWYVDELESGGAFLAVREPPRQCSSVTESCLEVADHLGISLGKTDRYH